MTVSPVQNHVIHLDEQVVEGKRLGRHVNHDPRSRAFAYAATAPVLVTTYHERVVPIFDQGNLGSCTGNASTGALGTKPFFATLPPGTTLNESVAVDVYSAATAIDGFDGQYKPDDTGSDGLSVAKVLKSRGLIAGYQHAFGLQQALAALQNYPVITGVPWYEGFDNPDSAGRVKISGQVRGGHEFEVVGVDVENREVRAANSWGEGYADKGYFTFSWDDWARLLGEQGDVTILLPLTVPPPQPSVHTDDEVLAAALHKWLDSRPCFYKSTVQAASKNWLAAKGL